MARRGTVGLMVFLLFLMGMVIDASYNRVMAQNSDMQQTVDRRVRGLNIILNLSNQQEAQVKKILTKQYEDMNAAKVLPSEQQAAAEEKVREQTETAMQKVLSDKQFTKYNKYRTRYEQKHSIDPNPAPAKSAMPATNE